VGEEENLFSSPSRASAKAKRRKSIFFALLTKVFKKSKMKIEETKRYGKEKETRRSL